MKPAHFMDARCEIVQFIDARCKIMSLKDLRCEGLCNWGIR